MKYLDSPTSEQLFDDADFWEVSFHINPSFHMLHQTLADGQICSDGYFDNLSDSISHSAYRFASVQIIHFHFFIHFHLFQQGKYIQ